MSIKTPKNVTLFNKAKFEFVVLRNWMSIILQFYYCITELCCFSFQTDKLALSLSEEVILPTWSVERHHQNAATPCSVHVKIILMFLGLLTADNDSVKGKPNNMFYVILFLSNLFEHRSLNYVYVRKICCQESHGFNSIIVFLLHHDHALTYASAFFILLCSSETKMLMNKNFTLVFRTLTWKNLWLSIYIYELVMCVLIILLKWVLKLVTL